MSHFLSVYPGHEMWPEMGTYLGPGTLGHLRFFGILQGSNHIIILD